MTAPHRILPLLRTAWDALEDAQAHVDAWDRAAMGRPLDALRWALGDLVARYADALGDTDETWPGAHSDATTVGNSCRVPQPNSKSGDQE